MQTALTLEQAQQEAEIAARREAELLERLRQELLRKERERKPKDPQDDDSEPGDVDWAFRPDSGSTLLRGGTVRAKHCSPLLYIGPLNGRYLTPALLKGN